MLFAIAFIVTFLNGGLTGLYRINPGNVGFKEKKDTQFSSGADEILIVAAPDLAGLRNVKNLLALLHQQRPNDARARVVLNGVGMPKRPEIAAAAEFAKALDVPLQAVIPFEPALFGTAANNGQMIAEVQAGSKPAEIFSELAAAVTGRSEIRRARANLLEPLLAPEPCGRRRGLLLRLDRRRRVPRMAGGQGTARRRGVAGAELIPRPEPSPLCGGGGLAHARRERGRFRSCRKRRFPHPLRGEEARHGLRPSFSRPRAG